MQTFVRVSPPHRLHLSKTQGVIMLIDAYRWKLVCDFSAIGLEPCD